MSTIKFTATKLKNTGKVGLLKPDDNGYFTLPIGGLNTFNSVGEYYTLEGAKSLFEESSIFMRRVNNGCLKGEVGHPKKLPGMTNDDYFRRVMSIEETNVCCHFKEVWLDESYGKSRPELQNSNLVAIMAKVKPAGPKATSLQASLENADENVCFSIRALTKDYYNRGQTFRVLESIMTFDNVNEPGIATSTKWNSPALESIDEMFIKEKQLISMIEDDSLFSMEDSKEVIREAICRIRDIPSIPVYTKW